MTQSPEELLAWQRQVALLEMAGTVTRAFRRLDPDRQRAVVGAVVAAAAAHGPAGVQVKEVAERSGVAVGSLYQYFPKRDGMVAAAIEVAVGYLSAVLTESAPYLRAMPLRDGLLAYLGTGVEWSAENADLLRLFARAAYAGDTPHAETVVRPVAEAMRKCLRALLEGAAERGELRPDVDLDAAVRFVHVVTAAVGDAQLVPHLDDYYLLFDADHTADAVVPQMVDLVVRAIGASS